MINISTVLVGIYLFVVGAKASLPPPQWARVSSFTRFLDHTQRPTTVGRTPLDEWSARRRDLYPSTHNTDYRQTPMPLWDSTHNLSRRAATYPRLRPRGHRDPLCILSNIIWEVIRQALEKVLCHVGQIEWAYNLRRLLVICIGRVRLVVL
jgi:hypothetical protein